MADEFESFRRPWALGTAVVGFAMVAIYVALILGDGTSSFLDALPWATLMALPATAALASAYIKDRRIARNMLIAAAVIFARARFDKHPQHRTGILVGRGPGNDRRRPR